MDFAKLIEAAREENGHGIEMRRGKRYTAVAVRVELMRRHLGGLGISTEIVTYSTDKGAPIVVKATISDEAGRVLASGHAEEIRGQGTVNSTSALENAETSAIGRALAALGVSGGEFASVNEMERADAKRADPVQETPPEKPAAPRDPVTVADALIESVKAATDAANLEARLKGPKFSDAYKWLSIADVGQSAFVDAAVYAKRAEFAQGQAA
jgi:hypothetical protein